MARGIAEGALPLTRLTLLALLAPLAGCGEPSSAVPYAELSRDVRAGRVARLEACVEGQTARYRHVLNDGAGSGATGEERRSVGPAPSDELLEAADERGVPVEIRREGCE
jgi:hypothetical protein